MRHLTKERGKHSFELIIWLCCLYFFPLSFFNASAQPGPPPPGPAPSYSIKWNDLQGVTISNGILTKTATAGWTNGGGNSSNILAANTDGWIEFTVTTERVFFIGFIQKNAAWDYGNFSHAIDITSAGAIRTWEGSVQTVFGNVVSGDVFTISREGSQVIYSLNGVAIRTVTVDPSLVLIPRALIYNTNSKTPPASASIVQKLSSVATIVGTSLSQPTGSVSLTVTGGATPYAYQWDSGESTALISGKGLGAYPVTITDAEGATLTTSYNVGYKASYIDLKSVTESAGKLTKTSVQGWNSGANTSNILPADTDGWIEFVAGSPGSQFAVGFGNNFGEYLIDDFRFGYLLHTNQYFYCYEGATVTSISQWQAGDVFRIAREGASIKYYHNGVVVRTLAAPGYELWAKTIIYLGSAPAVATSFPAQIFVQGDATGTGFADGTGSIALGVKGGTAPYTYNWSSGETGNTISNKPRGSYTVTVTDAEGRQKTHTFRIGYVLAFNYLKSVTESSGRLTKTAGSGWLAGGNSQNIIPFNTDGWLEFVATVDATYEIGFGNDVRSFVHDEFKYGLALFHGANSLNYYEGAAGSSFGSYFPGDIVRIERVGGTIKYYRNEQLMRSVNTDSKLELYVKVALHTQFGLTPKVTTSFDQYADIQAVVNGTNIADGIGNIALSPVFGTSPYTFNWSSGETSSEIQNKSRGQYSVTVTDAAGRVQNHTYGLEYKNNWSIIKGLTDAYGVLNKSIEPSWSNAGAVSLNVLNSNTDGWVEFVADDSYSTYQMGFATNFTTLGMYGAFTHAFRLDFPTRLLYAIDSDVYYILGSYMPGDVFRLSREGTNIKYYKNGALLRTVSIGSAPLVKNKVVVHTGKTPLVISSFPDATDPGEVPDDQEFLALKDLYINTVGYYWTNRTNWPTTWPSTVTNTAFKTWYGVTVTNGDVTELNLVSNNMVGSLPASISNLKKLKKINFSFNKIFGDVPPLTNLAELTELKVHNNQLTGIGDLTTIPNAAARTVFVDNNFLEFGDLESCFTGPGTTPFASIRYSPQPDIGTVQTVVWQMGVPATVSVTTPGLFNRYQWQKKNDDGSWSNIPGQTQPQLQRDYVIELDAGYYRLAITNEKATSLTLYSNTIAVTVQGPGEGGNVALIGIPQALKIGRDGRKIADPEKTTQGLVDLIEGEKYNVISRPPCLDGDYYIAFELVHEIGPGALVSSPWDAQLAIILLKDNAPLWTQPLSLQNDKLQTVVSTIFHDQVISCDDNYQFEVKRKDVTPDAPVEDITLKIHFYKIPDQAFDPAAAISLNCAYADQKTVLSWTTAAQRVKEFDLEWVFIEEHEDFTGTTADQAFAFKEPVRVATNKLSYEMQVYYPNGRLWYRIRAIGENPSYPGHRINGNWFYSPCASVTIANHEANKNWQAQTVYSEEGKYKKIMTYFDGTLRQRQSLTNLSQKEVTNTLVGETYYDFEGRSSLSIMAVPSADAKLTYKPGFNVFADAAASTPTKALYDNGTIENSVLSQTVGAGKYYSPANDQSTIHRNFIPDSEGYAYSQTEYLRDGTGRVSKQSGVGKEFRIDGEHATRYYYGNVSQEELLRLFGSNAGKAAHYKKNLVVDANGQVSISYMDQEDRVIATALAGDAPANVDVLPSYSQLDPEPLNVNITSKNVKANGVSVTSHKILNAYSQTYTFKYDLSAYGYELEEFGCQNCYFDLIITITNPEGRLIDLSGIDGNESTVAGPRPYEIRDISAVSCTTEEHRTIEFPLLLNEIGDYTITKTLIPHELTFEQMKTIVEQQASVQTKIQQVRDSYTVDAADCEICAGEQTPSGCPDGDAVINEAINNIATEDCENIMRLLLSELEAITPEIPVAQQEISDHPSYCHYLLCVKDKEADVFDKQIVRVESWSAAVTAGYNDMINVDPFFNNTALSGAAYKADMESRINDILVATLTYDDDGDGIETEHEFRGPIEEITDPDDPDMYINESGQTGPSKHILYIDLMDKRASLGEEAYLAQLDKQRWTLYRSFYQEAKRLTKLSIPAYEACPAARAPLELVDELNGLQTDEEIAAFGEEHGLEMNVSDEEVAMTVYSIEGECDAIITDADKALISDHLKTYFDSNPKNFFRVIIRTDLSENPSLLAIEEILSKPEYGCTLDSVVVDDPLVCVDAEIIEIPESFNPDPLSSMKELSNEEEVIVGGVTAPEDTGGETTGDEEPDQTAPVAPSGQDYYSSQNTNSTEILDAEEFNALLDLYESTRPVINGVQINWRYSTGWAQAVRDNPTSVSDWYGVVTEGSHVVKLTLRSNNLQGTLPASIGKLTYLRELDLAGSSSALATYTNNIGGAIPGALGNLTALTLLNLNYNSFTEVPAEIGSLVNLDRLYLNRRLGVGTGLPSLPNELCYLGNLTLLELENCKLPSLPQAFGQFFAKLTSLNLAGNSLTTLPDHFHGALAGDNGMPLLTSLRLESNLLTTLPPNFGNNWTSLVRLTIYNNDLTQLTDYFRGPNESGPGMDALEYLQFSLNSQEIYANPLVSLPPTFGQNWTSLKTLVMSYTKLASLSEYFHGDIGGVHGMDNLVTLTMNSVVGDDVGLLTLPANFGQNLTQLRDLSLSGHRLQAVSDHFVGSMTEGIGMKSLETLDFRHNLLSDLPDNFGQELTTLKTLWLSDNKLTAPTETLALSNYFFGSKDGLTGMSGLQTLYLAQNELVLLPNNFGENWTSLIELHLQNNNLISLPDNFHGSLETGEYGTNNLEVLKLGDDTRQYSNLLEDLPVHFGKNLTKLRVLHIQHNKLKTLENHDYFQGSDLPETGMKSLQDLYLHQNQITALPANFGKSLTTLEELFLYDNLLTTLPDNFHGADPILGDGLNNLKFLRLGFIEGSYTYFAGLQVSKTVNDQKSNELGSLPANFGKNLHQLVELRLEGNNLAALTPYFHGGVDGMSKLINLNLHDNKLNALPPNFGNSWPSLTILYLNKNELQSLTDYFCACGGTGMSNLQKLFLGNMSGTTPSGEDVFNMGGNEIQNLPANFGQGWNKMTELHLEGNGITDITALNAEVAGMPLLTRLNLHNNSIIAIPGNFGRNFPNLTVLTLANNSIEVFEPDPAVLPKIQKLDLSRNKIALFSQQLWALQSLTALNLAVNLLDNRIDPNIPAMMDYLYISYNKLTFADLLPLVKNLPSGISIIYSPQGKIDLEDVIKKKVGDVVTLEALIDRNLVQDLGEGYQACTYRWFHAPQDGTFDILKNGHQTDPFTITESHEGYQYYYEIYNSDAPHLKLQSDIQTIVLHKPKTFELCRGYNPNDPTLAAFTYSQQDFINNLVQRCMDNAAEEREILVESAIEEVIEEEVSTYYTKYQTNCFETISETLSYSYIPKEYHYTLYYYDQSGSLSQTVPPNGVKPWSNTQVYNFIAGTIQEDPEHELVTQYKYSSLNQLLWQKTPDAGVSRFWYNEKGQLRLSQNAKQSLENHYSYTKYDEQGRISEVGEMTAAAVEPLLAKVEGLQFPLETEYTLTDITRTHYDLPTETALPLGFSQNNLRSRVAWVEVSQKDRPGAVSTYYDYDVHGNVRSLVQQIPGLDFKRTDYVYDRVSGKVNYVMYQYGFEDQFIHRYTYDTDNRIEEVYTSTDGFIWDREASYLYYQHGPLARVELGEHTVQGQDYYHTLQGWIKGVNMPYANDLMGDGTGISRVGRDVYAYTLGYYQGDYKSIDPAQIQSDTRDQLWTRYAETYNNPGLYNGNISWMETDLADFGNKDLDRANGMQAMVYRYDQLHRIISGKSLGSYDPATGFPSRTGDGAYDENYSYDANGNILTLLRRDEKAAVKDNWQYTYYANTNRLMKVKPEASVTYDYDAIGNLISDQEEGTTILWTPYGKVHEVHRSDGSKIKYRYDAMGNRVEKKVEKTDLVVTSHYVRDASGKVMAVYKDTKAIEHSIYGSGRLGLYTGGRKQGDRTLGQKTYELSNHLGNVLAVITDNVNRTAESATATVAQVNDYYPFGLDMPGRTAVAQEEAGEESDEPGTQDAYPGLISHHPLNGDAKDAAGHLANGIITGATPTADNEGGANQALAFDGNDYVNLPNTKDALSFVQNTHKFTIAAYVKFSDLTLRSAIISTIGTTAGKGFTFMFENATTAPFEYKYLRFFSTWGVSGSLNQAKGVQGTVNDNNWHHVAVIGDGKMLQLYIDGQPNGPAVAVIYNSTGASSRDAAIGAIPDLTGTGYSATTEMNGSIDDLFVFNRALTQQELQKLAERKPVVELPTEESTNETTNAYRYGFNGKEKDAFASAAEAGTETCVTCGDLRSKLSDLVKQSGDQALLDITQVTTYLNTSLSKTYSEAQYQQAINTCKLTDFHLNFNGDSYISFGDQSQYRMGTSDFTIEAWVKYPASIDNSLYPIVSNQEYFGSVPNFSGINFAIFNKQIYFSVADGSSYNSIRTTSLPAGNAWHHIVVQRVGNMASDFNIFVDGVEVPTYVDFQGLTDGDIDVDGVEALKIGSRAGSYDNTAFKGELKQVRMYKRLLSSQEVAASYDYGCGTEPIDPTALVLWVPLNEGQNTTVRDLSSYGQPSTWVGTNLTWKGALSNISCVNGTRQVLCTSETVVSNVQYDYGFRIYNPQIAKFLTVDPLSPKYPWYTPYQYAGNMPVVFVDVDGLEPGADARQERIDRGIMPDIYTAEQIEKSNAAYNQGQRQGLMIAGAIVGAVFAWEFAGGWVLANWHHLVYNPVVHNEIGAGIYGLVGDDEWPVPAVGDNATKTLRYLYYPDELVENSGRLIIHEGASFANEAEKAISIYLTKKGHDVQVLKEVSKDGIEGVRTADYVVDGVKTEIKAISDVKDKSSDGISNAIKDRLSKASGQAKNVIIDLTNQQGASLEIARRGVARYFGQSKGNMESVRVIGDGFDEIIPNTITKR